MKDFAVYDPTTGEILRWGTLGNDADIDLQPGIGEAVIEGVADDAIHYILSGVLTPKSMMGASIDKTTAAEGELITISNVPAGTVARVTGASPVVVNDGSLILTFSTVGSYNVRLECFPYLGWEVDLAITG